jgi:hypothetical protein
MSEIDFFPRQSDKDAASASSIVVLWIVAACPGALEAGMQSLLLPIVLSSDPTDLHLD